MNRALWTCFLIIVSLSVIGCGQSGPEIATVTGHVTLDGQPLASAQLMFIPAQGRPSVGKTDEQGNYKLEYTEARKGAIPGKCRVEITTWAPGYVNEKGENVPAMKEVVPVKYNRDTTLEFEVKAKTANVANFDIESKGKIAPPPKD